MDRIKLKLTPLSEKKRIGQKDGMSNRVQEARTRMEVDRERMGLSMVVGMGWTRLQIRWIRWLSEYAPSNPPSLGRLALAPVEILYSAICSLAEVSVCPLTGLDPLGRKEMFRCPDFEIPSQSLSQYLLNVYAHCHSLFAKQHCSPSFALPLITCM